MRTTIWTLPLLGLAVAVCAPACASSAAEKEAVADDAQEYSTWSANWRIAGSLAFGESASERHSGSPRYRAFKFAANGGDTVDIWVRSRNGDPVTFLLNDDFKVVAKNDDASPSNTNSHIATRLPQHRSRTHYVVVRDYDYAAFDFTVALEGVHDFDYCSRDSDCTKVERGCCPLGQYTAVRSVAEDFYRDALACDPNPICPKIATRPNDDVAQCDVSRHACELVAPRDIECGGRSLNPHACPRGYTCDEPGNDAPGDCLKRCGGIAGLRCDQGEVCVDDPSDGCDPKSGADCIGVCKRADCRQNGCNSGQWCSFCWGSYKCIPNGSRC
jgi:hypothetical protein